MPDVEPLEITTRCRCWKRPHRGFVLRRRGTYLRFSEHLFACPGEGGFGAARVALVRDLSYGPGALDRRHADPGTLRRRAGGAWQRLGTGRLLREALAGWRSCGVRGPGADRQPIAHGPTIRKCVAYRGVHRGRCLLRA